MDPAAGTARQQTSPFSANWMAPRAFSSSLNSAAWRSACPASASVRGQSCRRRRGPRASGSRLACRSDMAEMAAAMVALSTALFDRSKSQGRIRRPSTYVTAINIHTLQKN
jgi:hypothetical protein